MNKFNAGWCGAAAPSAMAKGNVGVHQLDDAMRQVIERQDALGDLVDVLLPLLRATRKLERGGVSAEKTGRCRRGRERVKGRCT